jgi:small nuclear ribonucleoprotein (snRNP)-like protein
MDGAMNTVLTDPEETRDLSDQERERDIETVIIY